ncbi:MAG: hypothetical protein KZQ87_07625 [Candidatus Thiodiazotropha sp. (ex Cardiolucina cf. quadrata)]|nr:hypothetical protein [Candidatus Thiodiazotropha sp. (ex Cardiolucina cf. quadrata)]
MENQTTGETQQTRKLYPDNLFNFIENQPDQYEKPTRHEWHSLKTNFRIFVIPAQAGIQEYRLHQAFWIPACAGMTVVLGLSKCHSYKTLKISFNNLTMSFALIHVNTNNNMIHPSRTLLHKAG